MARRTVSRRPRRPSGASRAIPDRASDIRTFLIADIRGYTKFTEEQGDQAAARLARKFAEIAGEGVEAWGGDVIELRGDEALAVFHSPRKAIRAAVELQQTFAEETLLAPSLPLNVGMGLDAGEGVPVGEGYRGAALNLAARLCAQAGPGEILASREAVHLARKVEGVQYERLAARVLKGMDEAIELIRVVPVPEAPAAAVELPSEEAVAARPELPTELDPVTPLVDREPQLRWLRWAWRRARHGHGRAVFLAGPTGIGKTRLAAELAREAFAEGAEVLYARCAGPAQTALEVLHRGRERKAPTLLVADDLDVAGGTLLSFAARFLDGITGRPVLVVGTLRSDRSRTIASLLERAGPKDEVVSRLAPLDAEGVREIMALHAGGSAASLNVEEVLKETGGVPAAVHQLASTWVGERAASRLGKSANRAASGRRGLRAAEVRVARDVVGLQVARERASLYAAQPAAEEELAAPAVCPFKGLATFEASDAEYFFGRERLVAEMVARLVGAPFLGVVGPSGSGKSSAVRAGLLPGLAGGVLPGSERWAQRMMRPGDHPMAELEQTLNASMPGTRRTRRGEDHDPVQRVLEKLRDNRRLVLLVDQFEELFTICHDEEERAAFVGTLVRLAREAAGRAAVVLAVRADYYGHCAAFPELAELLGANHVLVGPMREEELRRAIELPAYRASLRVEPELTDELVTEVVDEPGGLPLLSTTLLELWQRREGRVLSLAAYREAGGVRGAVARIAEAAYARLSPVQQQLSRAVLLRLAGEGSGQAVVRRRVPLSEFDLDRNEDAARLLTVLTEARLLTASEGHVEVAHEALLREWPRLREWLNENTEGRRLHLHLMQQAKEWEQRGRDDADLYRGARLASALDWTAHHAVELNERERAFLGASSAAHERANRRLRMGLAVVASLLVAALVASALFLVQRGRAREEAGRATAQELVAAARANLDTDPERSILLAIEAVEATRRDHPTLLREAEAVLHDALATSRVVLTVKGAGPKSAFAPDGRRFVSAGSGDAFVVWDARTGREVFTVETGSDKVHTAAYSPDGRLIVTAGSDGAQIWDAQTGRPVRRLGRKGAAIINALISPDGSRILTVGDDANVSVWDAHTGAALARFRAWEESGPDPFQTEVAGFAGAERVVALNLFREGGQDIVFARVWDAASGSLVSQLEDRNVPSLPPLIALDLSPDGRLIAIGHEGGGVSLVRLADGRLLDQVHVGGAWAYDVEFSQDGKRLAAASSNAAATVWDITPHGLQESLTLAGHAREVLSVSFSADGTRLLTGSSDGTARIRDVSASGGAEVLALPGPEQPLRGAVEFTPDGRTLVASSGPQGTVQVWDVATGRRELLIDQHARQANPERQILGIDVSPDGSRIATASSDGTARVFDARTGEELSRIHPDCFVQAKLLCWVLDVEFSADGERLATAGGDSLVRIFDVASGRELRELRRHKDFVFTVKFNPAYTRLVTAGSFDSTARVWNVETGRRVLTLRHEPGDTVHSAAYSPDGTRIATVDSGGNLRLWDARSGRKLLEISTSFGQLFPVAFSPDGRRLATAAGETVLLLHAADGTEVLRLQGGALGQADLVFSPDGKLLAWVSPLPNPSVRVVTLDVDRLLEVARTRVTRSLTDDECRQYLHVNACPRD